MRKLGEGDNDDGAADEDNSLRARQRLTWMCELVEIISLQRAAAAGRKK